MTSHLIVGPQHEEGERERREPWTDRLNCKQARFIPCTCLMSKRLHSLQADFIPDLTVKSTLCKINQLFFTSQKDIRHGSTEGFCFYFLFCQRPIFFLSGFRPCCLLIVFASAVRVHAVSIPWVQHQSKTLTLCGKTVRHTGNLARGR